MTKEDESPMFLLKNTSEINLKSNNNNNIDYLAINNKLTP